MIRWFHAAILPVTVRNDLAGPTGFPGSQLKSAKERQGAVNAYQFQWLDIW